MISLFFYNLFMSLGIKSLTLIPQDCVPTCRQCLEGLVCASRVTSPHPERNKQAFQHSLFRKTTPDSAFHKRKQWQFIRTVLQIKRKEYTSKLNLKTSKLTWKQTSKPTGWSCLSLEHDESFFSSYFTSLSSNTGLSENIWRSIVGTWVAMSYFQNWLKPLGLGQLRECRAVKRMFPSQYLPHHALSLLWD